MNLLSHSNTTPRSAIRLAFNLPTAGIRTKSLANQSNDTSTQPLFRAVCRAISNLNAVFILVELIYIGRHFAFDLSLFSVFPPPTHTHPLSVLLLSSFPSSVLSSLFLMCSRFVNQFLLLILNNQVKKGYGEVRSFVGHMFEMAGKKAERRSRGCGG